MTKLIFEKAKLLNSYISKDNNKTYETYLFDVKGSQYIIIRQRTFIPSFTTTIIQLTKPLKDESIKTIYKFYNKNYETTRLANTKKNDKCVFTKGSIAFVTKTGETYKFRTFGGFFNLIKAGCFNI